MPRRLRTLSAKEMLILQMLIRESELYGLQMVAQSRGRLKRGTVYVTLGRMEDKGYVTSRAEKDTPPGGGLPRRIYRPTASGRQVYDAWSLAVERLMPEFVR